jgi:hypothetical protein
VLTFEFFDIKSGLHISCPGDPLETMPTLRESPRCGTAWKFRSKPNRDGSVAKRKSRVVLQGFTQVENVNFFDTYSSVTAYVTMKVIMCIAVIYGLVLWQIDFDTAYLWAPMSEIVYTYNIQAVHLLDHKKFEQKCLDKLLVVLMSQHRYRDGDEKQSVNHLLEREGWEMCLRLLKSLYGAHQSGANFDRVSSKTIIEDCGMDRMQRDDQCFIKRGRDAASSLYCGKLVDDMLVAVPVESPMLRELIDTLNKSYSVTLKRVDVFAGLTVTQNLLQKWVHVNVERQTLAMVDKFHLDTTCRPLVPIRHGTVLTKEDCPIVYSDKPTERAVWYKSAIQTTNWLTLVCRYDCAAAQSMLARFSANPGEIHVRLMREYMCYMVASSGYGILFRRTDDRKRDIRMLGYGDADFAGDRDTRRSRGAQGLMWVNGFLYFTSKLQQIITLNTHEAEVVATVDLAKGAKGVVELVEEMGIPLERPIVLNNDNDAACKTLMRSGFSGRSKHFDVRYLWLHQHIESNLFIIQHCVGVDNKVDIGTKLFEVRNFQRAREMVVSLRPDNK